MVKSPKGEAVVHKFSYLVLFLSIPLQARMASKDLCNDIMSKTDYVISGMVLEDLESNKTSRVLKVKLGDVYPRNGWIGKVITLQGIGKVSIEGAPPLKGKRIKVFLKDLRILGGGSKPALPPYSIIIDGHKATFQGPVNYNKTYLPDELWNKDLESIVEKIKQSCTEMKRGMLSSRITPSQ